MQREPIRQVLDMVSDASNAYPSTYAIVAPTSGGKSLCRDTIGRMLRGIYWTICPLLSLSADQTEKMAEYQTEFGDSRIRAIHLDEIESDASIQSITTTINGMFDDTSRVAAIFSSPQCLKKPWVQQLFDSTLAKGLLRLFCVDEVHAATRHALTFHSIYKDLKEPVFDKASLL